MILIQCFFNNEASMSKENDLKRCKITKNCSNLGIAKDLTLYLGIVSSFDKAPCLQKGVLGITQRHRFN